MALVFEREKVMEGPLISNIIFKEISSSCIYCFIWGGWAKGRKMENQTYLYAFLCIYAQSVCVFD